MTLNKYVFFDLETTGFELPQHRNNALPKTPEDEIIQIAAIATKGPPDFCETSRFEIKIMPTPNGLGRMDTNHRANGFDFRYRENEWKDNSYTQGEGLREFAKYLSFNATMKKISKRGRPYKIALLAGHNVTKFDIPFLYAAFRKHDFFAPFSFLALDTLALCPWLRALGMLDCEKSYLGSLCEHFGITLEDAHDALADVSATVQIARKFCSMLGFIK